MAEIIIIDRIWLFDYLHSLRQEMRITENIAENLEKAKSSCDDAVKRTVYVSLIEDMTSLLDEFRIVQDVLEQMLNGAEEASSALNLWDDYDNFSHIF